MTSNVTQIKLYIFVFKLGGFYIFFKAQHAGSNSTHEERILMYSDLESIHSDPTDSVGSTIQSAKLSSL